VKSARESVAVVNLRPTVVHVDSRVGRASDPARLRGCILSAVVATAAFGQPLIALLSHALSSELFSYIVLIPFISGYLIALKRRVLPQNYRTSVVGTAILSLTASAALAGAWYWHSQLSTTDYVALTALAYVATLNAATFFWLGASWMKAAAFPMAFLVFVVPLPDAAVLWLENASVLGSTEVAAFLFDATRTPLMRDGSILSLPGIVLRVAQECSGIRSSWVLFITSLVTSHLFLVSPWRRFVLVVFVIPLALVRNGFRILVIGLMCVHIGPHMIDSFIHHRGGPIFFTLSLFPLFGLLWWLRQGDARRPLRQASAAGQTM
jgi:exosortase C (VPDSG-CTERM-specific)